MTKYLLYKTKIMYWSFEGLSRDRKAILRIYTPTFLGRLFGKTETWLRPDPDRTFACVPVPDS